MLTSIQAIQAKLAPHSAALVTSPVNRRYLTGFASSDGSLFITNNAAVFYTDSRYIEAARAAITACEVLEHKGVAAQLRTLCKAHGVWKMYIETQFTTLHNMKRMQKMLPRTRILHSNLLDDTLLQLRQSKQPHEVQSIRRAQAIAEAALDTLLEQLHPGMTERQIALELDFAMLRGGAQAISFDTIALAGENGSKPHGVPGERALQSGDFLTLDFGAVVNGYHSDMTRTLAIGKPGEEQAHIYQTVLEAQQAALAAMRPGALCKDIDAAARAVIEDAGYGEYFRHSTGHGVGLEIHEAPSLYAGSGTALAPGMVVTAEPGIYVPGLCGVRIEDMALITEDGYENLTNTDKSLRVLE